MFDLSRVSLASMTECSAALRRLGGDAASMEEAASDVVRYLFETLVDGEGERACALVRFYKTESYAQLPAELREFAAAASSDALAEDMQCLTLLSTRGVEPAWCERSRSQAHRVIPLPSPDAVKRAPMVAQLVRALGFEIAEIVAPDPALMLERGQREFNVFHVEKAEGSPYIPAQDFVRRYGIASVLGFGGVLPGVELFAIILFSRVPITAQAAELFRPLSLSAKMAVLPFAGGQVFA